jgi:hypothetical protein
MEIIPTGCYFQAIWVATFAIAMTQIRMLKDHIRRWQQHSSRTVYIGG